MQDGEDIENRVKRQSKKRGLSAKMQWQEWVQHNQGGELQSLTGTEGVYKEAQKMWL